MSETKQTRTGVLTTSDGRRIDLNEFSEPLVLAAIEIIKHAGGYNSPYETFLECLLQDYSRQGLSVTSIENDLQEMRDNLESIEQDIRLYAERYRPMLERAIAEVASTKALGAA